MRFDLTDPDLAHLLRWVQDGVVSRRQLLELEATPKDIERLLRRRDLAKAHPGVYVNHSGRLSRVQREWVAVLAAWPAALSHESALPNPPTPVVQVAVDVRRTVRVPERAVVHRMTDFHQRVRWQCAPPRVEPEHALLDVMQHHVRQRDIAAAYAALTRVAHTRSVGPQAMLSALDSRDRIHGRAAIQGMIADLRDGA